MKVNLKSSQLTNIVWVVCKKFSDLQLTVYADLVNYSVFLFTTTVQSTLAILNIA